jgi:DNA uptake protein ComE-like DNA-binding protein
MLQSILATKFVDIVSVHTNASRSEFSQDEVEKLAHNFLLSGGSTRPLIVRPKNAEEYDVIEGHLEFYAALRAKELDDNFEMIQAIILDSKNEKAIVEQVNLFKEITPSPVTPPSDNKLIERIKNLEKQLSSDINNLKTQLSNQTESPDLESILKSQLDALRNDLTGEKFIQEIVDRVIDGIEKPIKMVERIKLNTASKRELINVPGIGEKIASAIINIRNKKETKRFENIDELTEINRITLNMIENNKWHEWFIID